MKNILLHFKIFDLTRMPFYAVRKGRVPGIYLNWSDCEDQVKGFPKPIFKKFSTQPEALNFIHSTQNLLKNVRSKRAELKAVKDQKRNHVNNEDIDVDKESSIISVYTDGCCRSNGKSNPYAGIGVYWGSPDHPDNLSEPLTGRQTNNRAEIIAVVRALEQAKLKNIKEIVVYTDSAFLINCITKWIKKWKKNNWKLSNGGDVINQEELELLESTQLGIDVKYVHVRGHCGNKGNEEADRLANEGALKGLHSSL